MSKTDEFNEDAVVEDLGDEWVTDESAGPTSSFVAKVVDPMFGYRQDYNNGESLLLEWPLEVLGVRDWENPDQWITEEAEWPDFMQDDFSVSFPVGKDWDTEDGGDTCEHPTRTRFDPTGMYGRILATTTGQITNFGDNAVRTDGVDIDSNLFDKLRPVMAARKPANRSTRAASTWNGMIFEFHRLAITYPRRKGDDLVSERFMPIVFVGESDEEAQAHLAGEEAKPATKPARKRRSTKKKEEEKAEAPAEEAEEAEDTPSDGELTDAVVAYCETNGIEVTKKEAEAIAGFITSAEDQDALEAAFEGSPFDGNNEAVMDAAFDPDDGFLSLKG